MSQFRDVKISENEMFSYESEKIAILPRKRYQVSTKIIGIHGIPYSAYFAVFQLSNQGEVTRHIRWLIDFTGEKEYQIVFTTSSKAKSIVIGYRINSETPVRGDFEAKLLEPSIIPLKESDALTDSHDDINEFKISPIKSLTIDEESDLERNLVWIFGSPRSGTTWLAERLLSHLGNVVLSEPMIGFHMGLLAIDGVWQGTLEIERIFDLHLKRADYFFTNKYEEVWKPFLRKLILNRFFAQIGTIEKNVIVKDPSGSNAADMVMKCLPNSKLIFLVRDGRDVVDSRMDMHLKNSWAGLKPLETTTQRIAAIQWYALVWNKNTEWVNRAYQNHDPKLRLLVKYENLLKNTFTELKKITEFIGTEISADQLLQTVKKYDFKNIPNSKKGSGKFDRSATVGGWQKNFTDKEKMIMNNMMNPMLRQMGYL